MRQWILGMVALISAGCAGSNNPDPSPLHALCMNACAHIHAENCLESPAVDVLNCESECANADSSSNSPCTDEQAAYYACTVSATIRCASISGVPPTVLGCEAEEAKMTACGSPSLTCLRSPGSDDTCFKFGFGGVFFACSEGINPGPQCIQVTNTGFCCPEGIP